MTSLKLRYYDVTKTLLLWRHEPRYYSVTNPATMTSLKLCYYDVTNPATMTSLKLCYYDVTHIRDELVTIWETPIMDKENC